jgi:hypothetical protein
MRIAFFTQKGVKKGIWGFSLEMAKGISLPSGERRW